MKSYFILFFREINENAIEILRIMRDLSFAQVLFESGDKELATKTIKEIEEKIEKYPIAQTSPLLFHPLQHQQSHIFLVYYYSS